MAGAAHARRWGNRRAVEFSVVWGDGGIVPMLADGPHFQGRDARVTFPSRRAEPSGECSDQSSGAFSKSVGRTQPAEIFSPFM